MKSQSPWDGKDGAVHRPPTTPKRASASSMRRCGRSNGADRRRPRCPISLTVSALRGGLSTAISAGTEDLFIAAAEVALGSFVSQVEAITADMDVTGQLVEVVAYIIERLPHEPQLALTAGT